MEALGAAAAALQLATQCFEALQIIEHIRVSGKLLKSYQSQLENLRQISSKIAENPLLHTKDITSHIKSILSVIEQQDLSSLLERGRLYRSWVFILRERSLTQHFNTLEHLKVTLILTIQERQSETLHDIYVGMTTLSPQTPTVQSTPVESCIEKSSSEASLPNTTALVKAPMDHGVEAQRPPEPQPQGNEHTNERRSYNNERPLNYNLYSDNTASPKCNQTNGPVYLGINKNVPNSEIRITNHYKHNLKENIAGGLQVNGPRFEHSGDLAIQPDIVGMVYNNNAVKDVPGGEGSPADGTGNIVRAEQINGPLVLGGEKFQNLRNYL